MPNHSTFYFAWASAAETSFNAGHMREDELIFSFELKHEEGQFAELEIEVTKPRIGILAPGRPLWAWFSWSNGVTVYPLFFGRVIGIPDDLMGDIIRLRFIAKPGDYASRQARLADSLKVFPFYDGLYIDADKINDPNTVLEGYSALWHVDRITHAVTISDIIAGEDGVVEFTPNDVFYDSVKVKLSGSPLLVCEIETSLSWVQCDHTGVFEFKTQPNLVGNGDFGGGFKGTGYSGGGAKITFAPPDPDSPFTPDSQRNPPVQRTESWSERNMQPGPHKDGDMMEEAGSTTIPYYGGTLTKKDEKKVNADPDTGQGEEYSISESYIDNYETSGNPPSGGGGGGGGDSTTPTDGKIEVKVELEQTRNERIVVRVTADVQPVLVAATEVDDSIVERISMSARDPVEFGAATVSDGVFFSSTRGHFAVEYLLMVARAHLLQGSRVFETEWECPFSKIVNLSCRKNATLEDNRLPGGTVLGKIVTYVARGDGDSGEFGCTISMKSSVGNGTAITLAEGDPDYCDADYVGDDYQYFNGRFVAATTQDMTFSPLGFIPTGIQIPVTADQVLIRHEYNDTGQSARIQELIDSGAEMSRQFQMPSFGSSLGAPPQELIDYSNAQAAWEEQLNAALYDNPSWVELEFRPVQNISTNVEYTAEVSPLVIPMQVNLAAPSTP